MILQVAEGLQAIHEVGIIHRDLKTPNLMRDARGIVKLMDFGIAKGSEETGTGGLTVTGAVMGTPEYMSPEQCRGEKIDARSDIYSLGVVAYELFTGQVPFRGDTPVATIFKHIQDPVPLDTESRAQAASRRSSPCCAACWPRTGSSATPPPAEVAAALRQAKEESAGLPSTPAPPPPEPERTYPPPERRTTGRLEIFVNLMMRRVGTLGTVLQEERTIAENIGRGGARVLTTMSSLAAGDLIQLEEIGGDVQDPRRGAGSVRGQGQCPPPEPALRRRPGPRSAGAHGDGGGGPRRRGDPCPRERPPASVAHAHGMRAATAGDGDRCEDASDRAGLAEPPKSASR